MATKNKVAQRMRKRHGEEFKTEAVALAQKIGVAEAAAQLGLHESQLYGWHAKVRQNQGRSTEEQRLAAENARLKRELAEQTQELVILKNVWSAPALQGCLDRWHETVCVNVFGLLVKGRGFLVLMESAHADPYKALSH